MFISKLKYSCLLVIALIQAPLAARDILLEFKGAGFFPTSSRFRDIYHKSGALFGPEITVQLCEDNEHWYGFASVDYFSKKGRSIGLCSLTKVELVPLAFGVKYFVPFCYGNLYGGLGFQPTHLKTKNCLPTTTICTSQWGFGGIAKLGAYIDLQNIFCCDLCSDLFLDLFVDYSFTKIGCSKLCQTNTVFVTPLKANVSGALVGAGLGVRF